MLPSELRELLLAFNEHGVEYLLVGGYAVGTYAEPRATKTADAFSAIIGRRVPRAADREYPVSPQAQRPGTVAALATR